MNNGEIEILKKDVFVKHLQKYDFLFKEISEN